MATGSLDLRQEADENCSDGTRYYVCSGNLFAGCCSVNPCIGNTCHDHQDLANGDEEEGKEDGEFTSRPELTPSSSIANPLITSPLSEQSEAMPTDVTISESIAVSIINTSHSAAGSTKSQTEITFTESITIEFPQPSHTEGLGGDGVAPTDTTEKEAQRSTGLGLGEVIGICVGVAGVVALAAIFAILYKRRRRVRKATGSGDPGRTGFELQPYRLSSANPTQQPDAFDPFATKIKKGQFTRASAFKKLPSRLTDAADVSMLDQTDHTNERPLLILSKPVSPPAEAISSAVISQTHKSRSTHNHAPSADNSHEDFTRFDRSRADVSTPEVYGSLSFAQVAAFRGLPRIVEIPVRGRELQRTYVPYRPGAQASSSCDIAADGMRSGLNATEERLAKQHETSRAQYVKDPHE